MLGLYKAVYMGISDLGTNDYLELGRKLREARRRAGLSQGRVGQEMGLKPPSCASYVYRLERGKLTNIRFSTILRYLQACKAPVGRFMLELAQSGAFGEAEQGLTIAIDDSSSSLKQEKQAKLLYQKRWEREAQDSAIIARLWSEVMPAVQALLPSDPSRRLMAPYLEGVRAMYRAWKQTTRGAVNRDPVLDVQMAFDRIEQAGLQRLVPAAVHKMREIVFERLMEMTPQSGIT
jgi:transcriptional regulator with XRE-family HTH domain